MKKLPQIKSGRMSDKKIHAIEQIFQPQQGTDTFVEWIFVSNHALEGRGARRIVTD